MKSAIIKLWFILPGLALFLALTSLINQKVRFFLKAKSEPANIIVDPTITLGPINPIWQGLAQGGEEKFPFTSLIKEIAEIQPKYIRIDHIYDFYNVVSKKGENLVFNWQELDQVIDQILKTGALPFFSLSYMPPEISQSGEITDKPANWLDWSTVVNQTIRHYSGKDQRNLKSVVYEVWNEPDLFGSWKIGGGEKDYRLLYRYAVTGAQQAYNTNSFKIGGPAITTPYANWVNGFLDYVRQNQLRLDFYSWHRYTLNSEDFLTDVNKIDNWLFLNGGYSLDKYLTEWGPISEKSPLNDSDFAAAHLLASIRKLLQRVDLALAFEIKGGWGILNQEKAGLVEKKPRFFALQLLNKMAGERVKLEGEGSWVTGFASRESNRLKVILVNLDLKNQHFEMVPLTITNLEDGNYLYQETYLRGVNKNSQERVSGNSFKKQINLSPNNIIVIELTKIAPAF